MVSTYRTCEEHANCIVVFDYTRQGDCPCCERINEMQGDIDQANENEQQSLAEIEARKQIIEEKDQMIRKLREEILEKEDQLNG